MPLSDPNPTTPTAASQILFVREAKDERPRRHEAFAQEPSILLSPRGVAD
jgi:hypothetical protein